MVRRSKAQWQTLIESQQTSGLTVAEYCRQQDINAKYFYLRKRQLRNATGEFIKINPSVVSLPERTTPHIKLRVIDVELPLGGSNESDTLPLLLDRLLG